MSAPLSVAYLVDPRFPGGTSAALAAELAVTTGLARVKVNAIASRLFEGRDPAPVLAAALDTLGVAMDWDPPFVAADVVIVQNPAFLRFETGLPTRIVARDLIVVTHENFLRPGGHEAFDVTHCLDLIDRASLASSKSLAPISPYNRVSVETWLRDNGRATRWSVLDADWHNICAFDLTGATSRPMDRRGRHSRPGFEKFPALEVMDLCFPAHADANVIVGADTYLADQVDRPHWRMIPFGGIEIPSYFNMIDFMVYFTSPTWRESFGRVLPEAMAAGKVAISDPETAATFGGGVIGARPDEVDAVVAALVADPSRYRAQVAKAQAALAAFSARSFADAHAPIFAPPGRTAA